MLQLHEHTRMWRKFCWPVVSGTRLYQIGTFSNLALVLKKTCSQTRVSILPSAVPKLKAEVRFWSGAAQLQVSSMQGRKLEILVYKGDNKTILFLSEKSSYEYQNNFRCTVAIAAANAALCYQLLKTIPGLHKYFQADYRWKILPIMSLKLPCHQFNFALVSATGQNAKGFPQAGQVLLDPLMEIKLL